MTRQAYSYIRWSSSAQTSGDSLRRQVEASKAACAAHGWQLVDKSLIDMGISAYTGENLKEGALGQFIQLVKKGQIAKGSVLIIENFDRLSRQKLTDATELLLEIVNLGIAIYTTMDNRLIDKHELNNNPGCMLVVSISLMLANQDSEKKSIRLLEVNAKKRIDASQGKIIKRNIPFWLRVEEDGKELVWVIDEYGSWIMNMAYNLRDLGMGNVEIARLFNSRNYKIPMSVNKGTVFTATQINSWMDKPAVIGTLKYRNKNHGTTPNYYPPIIEEDLYFSVQYKIKNNVVAVGPKGVNHGNLFSGLMKCSCGSKLRYFRGEATRKLKRSTETKTYVYRTMKCIAALNHAGCNADLLDYDNFELEVLDYLFHNAELSIVDNTKIDDLVLLQSQLELLKAQERSYNSAIAGGLLNETIIKSANEVGLQIKELNFKIRDYIPEIPQRMIVDDFVKSYMEFLRETTDVMKRGTLAQSLKLLNVKVVVHEKNVNSSRLIWLHIGGKIVDYMLEENPRIKKPRTLAIQIE